MRTSRLLALGTLAAAVATTLLAGCASVGSGDASPAEPHSSPPPNAQPADPIGTWTSDDGNAWLTFEAEKFTGDEGCNAVKGSYLLDGDAIAFTPGLMTRMACPGVTLSFRTLTRAVIDDDRMTVYDAEGTELVVLTRS